MKKIVVLLILFILSFSHVVEWSEEDFTKAVESGKKVVVDFYANWCSHCKRFAPKFKQVANSYKAYSDIVFAKIDCEIHKDLCIKQTIIRYPTIRLYKDKSLKPLYYEGPRVQESYITFISYHFNAPTQLAPPIKLVKEISQEDLTMAMYSKQLSVILVQKEGDIMNEKATAMVDHLAENYLVSSNIHFFKHTFASEPTLDELRSFPLPLLPTFLLVYRGQIISYKYTYDEYQEKRVLSEEGVVDLINDYANINLNVLGKMFPTPGRIPEVDKMLRKATALDRVTLEAIEKAVEDAGREYNPFKSMYRDVIHIVKTGGIETIWKKLDEQRELIYKTEMEENGEEVEEEPKEDETDEDDEDDLNSLENLVLFRNILRSFAMDIPVGPFDEEELCYCLFLHNLFVFPAGIWFHFTVL